MKPPLAYERFVALLRSRNAVVQRTARAVTSPAIITLNYDVGLDYALHFSGTRFDYGTTEGTLPPDAVRLLKLHGSINWAACPTCNVLVPWHLSQFFQGHNWNIIPFGDDEDRTVVLDIADRFQALKHGCGEVVAPVPVVVPPTWNKTDNRLIQTVWRHAARELSEARYIVFAGYSFPETDLYFRYLLALGLAGEARLRRIVVLNPDKAAADRLRGMLNPNLQSRVEVVSDTFLNGVSSLEDLLDWNKSFPWQR